MLQIYENIRLLRKAHKMSQTELAEKVGYADKTMISHVENGRVDLPRSKIIQFAEVLGVTPSELMGDVNNDLSPDEHRLLELFRALNDEGQDLLFSQAELLIKGGYRHEL